MRAAGEEKWGSGAINCPERAKKAIELLPLSHSPVRISPDGVIMTIYDGFNQPYSHQLKSIKSFCYRILTE